MKFARLFILIGGLCAALGLGCASEPAGVTSVTSQGVTTEADQDFIGGGGDLCSAWASCYHFCRRFNHCTTPAGCDALGQCLTSCDSSYPSAPASCPYPEN